MLDFEFCILYPIVIHKFKIIMSLASASRLDSCYKCENMPYLGNEFCFDQRALIKNIINL